MPQQFEIVTYMTVPAPLPTGTQKTQTITLADANPLRLNGGVTSQAISLDVQAGLTNANPIYVGDATRQIVAIQKGQAWSPTAGVKLDVASVYVKGTAGDTINVLWTEVPA